jgi:hypothetical protein
MNKKLLIAILISLGLITLGSLICGFASWLFNHSFLGGFLMGFIALFTTGILYNSYIFFQAFKYVKELEAVQKIIDIHQDVELQCAVCKGINIIKVLLNKDNNFPCVRCGAPNSILMNFQTVVKTTPIDSKTEQEIIQDMHKKAGE